MNGQFEFGTDGVIKRGYEQVGYIQDDVIYAGGSGGPWGGEQVGQAQFPHPRWNAAAYFLLT